MTTTRKRSGVQIVVAGRQAAKKQSEPTQNHGHKHKNPAHKKPIVAPPRAPADLGITVAIGPISPRDDPDQPTTGKTFDHWTLLPLTPSTITIGSQANWTDGVFPVNGWEHSGYAGGQLENIGFSGRLEPPAFYVSDKSVGKLQAVEDGIWLGATPSSRVEARGYTGGSGVGVLPSENLDSLQTVSDGDGNLLVVESGQVGGPLHVDQDLVLQSHFWGTTFATPPTLPGGTDVVMQFGAIVSQGFVWHEPHDLAQMLRAACKGGEVVRMIIGDMYGINEMVSIRSFNWRIEDSDPDVINYDLTARQHRANPMPTGAVHHASKTPKAKSYVTKNGDTLHKIALLEWGNPNHVQHIVQLNRHTLEGLWVNADGNAVGGSFHPANESAGHPLVPRRPGGHKVGTIKRWPMPGFGPDTYLRKGIRLTMVAPAPKKKGKGKK